MTAEPLSGHESGECWMARTVIDVTNEHGLHARPAALFVRTAAQFRSRIRLRNLSRGGQEVDAKSIMQLLTAGVDRGSRVELLAEGDDAEQAIQALTDLVRSELDGH